jgi:hypothetical protein
MNYFQVKNFLIIIKIKKKKGNENFCGEIYELKFEKTKIIQTIKFLDLFNKNIEIDENFKKEFNTQKNISTIKFYKTISLGKYLFFFNYFFFFKLL